MSTNLAVVFAGTPDFALPFLDAIAASSHRLVAVYTQPDRPRGRGRRVTPSPVKERALELGVPVVQPQTLRESGARDALAAFVPDVLVVVAYGLLLPQAILDTPRLGCLNVHASLLPRWRGAAPVARAILAGDVKTGIAIMRMEAGLDTGPVMLRREVEIGSRESAGELEERLAQVGAEALCVALNLLAAGKATFEPQDPAQATQAPKLTRSEARLDWHESAAALARRVRALNPAPVAETTLDGAQLKVYEAEVVPAAGGAVPGTVLRADANGIVVMTGEQGLALQRVQLPGRRVVTAGELANARPLAGRVLGSV